MPVSVERSISDAFIPNGATTDFAFTFKAASADEIAVVDQDGTVLSSALYSVDLDDDEGGTVAFSVAPELADYEELYIVSDPALTQPADFDNAGSSFNPAALTQALDRAAVRDLVLSRRLDGAVRTSILETLAELPAAADRASKFMAFDAAGDPIASAGTGSDADLRNDLAASTGGALVAYIAAGAGATARTVTAKLRDAVSAKDYGATGDGTTDDTAAIRAAVTAVNTAGGGTVRLPIGTYIVSNGGSGAIAIIAASNVTLEGEGPGTVIKRADSSAAVHVVNIASGVENFAVRNLTIDGNRDNNTTSGHGIRVAGVTGLLVQNVTVKECYSYGIGIQAGANKKIKLDNVAIEDVGSDGIDIKNVDDANEDFQFTNVSVRRWGQNLSETTQAAVDCRGTVLIDGLFIAEPGDNDSVGLRFRQGELLATNGLGGHQSSVSNVDIRMDTATTVNGGGNVQFGIYSAARNVMVIGGSVNGGLRGVYTIESSNRYSLRVNACVGDGILVAQNVSDDPALNPHKTILDGCRVTNCAGDGIQIENNDCGLIGCQAESNTGYGLNITATANRTRVIGGVYGSNNTAGRINNGGASTTIIGVDSVDSKFQQNADFAAGIDVTGNVTGTGSAVFAAAIHTTGNGGVGYATGAGATVTQLTSKATSVTLNKMCGTVVTHNAALAAGAVVEFALDNTGIAATDTVIVNLASGAAVRTDYRYWVSSVSAGRARITIENRSAGSLSEALTFNFSVLKAVAA